MKTTLSETIDELTIEGELYETRENNKVRCLACFHRCVIFEGKRGICRVRFNKKGKLFVPFGYTAGIANDPIEKKPFFHFLPGTLSMTFGMLGCNFHCSYCQNWLSSQFLKDQKAGYKPYPISAEEIVMLAIKHNSSSITSSYNEPSITSEWAKEVFKKAKEKGIKTCYVSNGYATQESLDYLSPYLDGYKVDLKSFNDRNYRLLGGKLNNVLESIKYAHKKGLWVEIVTLIVPDFNDTDSELRKIAEFISSVSTDIPWHTTAFHPDYKMRDKSYTPYETIKRAHSIGKKAGLKFIYAGNLPMLGSLENTICPKCNTLLIRRQGFYIIENKLKKNSCPVCKEKIPGIYN